MAQAYTAGAKRRAKKARASLDDACGLAATPRRSKQGRARMVEIAEDPARATLATRARRAGLDGESRDIRADMASPAHAEGPHAAISLACGSDEAKTLIALYGEFSGSYERYARTVLAAPPHPECSRMVSAPDRFETSADAPAPDLRTQDERHHAACRSWDQWRERLDSIGQAHTSAIWTAFHGWRDLVAGGKTTAAGLRFIEALRAV